MFFVYLVENEIQFSIIWCLPPSAAWLVVKTVFANKDCNYIFFFPKHFFMWPPKKCYININKLLIIPQTSKKFINGSCKNFDHESRYNDKHTYLYKKISAKTVLTVRQAADGGRHCYIETVSQQDLQKSFISCLNRHLANFVYSNDRVPVFEANAFRWLNTPSCCNIPLIQQ